MPKLSNKALHIASYYHKMPNTRIILKLKQQFEPDNFVNQGTFRMLRKMGLKIMEPAYHFNMDAIQLAPNSIAGSKSMGKTIFLEFDGPLEKEVLIKNIKKLYKEKTDYIEEDEEIVFYSNSIEGAQKLNQQENGYPLQTINYSPYNTGSNNNMIVAIIDSGVNYDHESLRKSLWSATPSGESFGINLTISHKADWTNVKDNMGHGSLVAGIIGAYDNPYVTGIAQSVKLLSIKVFPKSSAKYFVRDVCSAMMNACWTGAKVINNSWRILKSDGGERKFLKETLSTLEKNNCIPVFAAGNENRDCSQIFPQSLPTVLNVGSITSNQEREKGTNWGESITVWAPGAGITSTYKDDTDSFAKSSGTSLAAPFVSGVVALLMAKNPNLSLIEVKEILRSKGTKIKIDKNKKQSYLLNFSNTLDIQPTINLKSNIMNAPFPTPPENMAEINSSIYTFLHLERSDIFQLLHNDVGADYICNFQIFGCFKGHKVVIQNEEKFLIEQVALKLVNMNPDNTLLYRIENAHFSINTGNEVDLEISIIETQNQEEGIDFTLDQLFLLSRFQKIDYHVQSGLKRNGYPCNQAAYF